MTSPARLAAAGGVPLADPSSGDGLVAYYPFNYNTPDVAGTTWNRAAEAGDAVLHAGAREVDDYLPPDRDASAVLTLDGVAGSLSSPATVRTDSSFAVAASVKVKSIGRSQVVVSQDGNRVSGFSLRVDPDGTSVFGIPKSDSESAGWDTVKGPKLVAGQWTHLAGVFDAVAGELRLYVNGVRVAAAKHTALWSATGQLQAGRGLSAGTAADYLAGSLDEVRAWSAAISDEAVTEATVPAAVQRNDQCTVGAWQHAGGSETKAVASAALAGTAHDRNMATWWTDYYSTPLQDAQRRDADAYQQLTSARSTRLAPVFGYLNGLQLNSPDDPTFRTAPGYASTIDTFLVNSQLQQPQIVLPKPDQAALNRALAIVADMRARPDYYHVPVVFGIPLVPDDDQIKGWSADRVAAWLRFGGYPTVTPDPGSVEFRFEVESAKLMWSDCDSADPEGAYAPGSMFSAGDAPPDPKPGPLALVTRTAQHEWNAELVAQAAPRNAIVAAEVQAYKDLRTASEAMLDAQYQAWVAGQLLKWQKLWLSRPKTYTGYPSAATFTAVSNDLAAIPGLVQAKLTAAQQAVTSANTQSSNVDTAKQQAANIATANGTPLYRGLLYARQSAQVVKASAAAAQSAVAAIQTTLNAVKATNADAGALQGLAATQQAAQHAQFERAAAQEAAAQAKAAADAAAAQATVAANAAATAKAKRTVAEQALATAKTAAGKAAAQRQIAEQQQAIAAAQEAVARQKHDEAAGADADAQRQRGIATQADSDARAQEGIAGQKDQDAKAQEQAAAQGRDAAYNARRARDGARAVAEAKDAAAAAADGTDDAQAAQAAATAAHQDADTAAAAADAAQADADTATAAAVDARAAATAARAAATAARAAANASAQDAADAQAAAATAHSAAADALAASHMASAASDAAKADAATAQADASKAAADSAAAQRDAADARASSAVTAGQAYAAAVWAVAARDSAAAVIAPANAAVALGTPFQQNDAAAGLSVLVGQEAKTIAAQQQAVAQARADEAARAATAAAALAAQATGDAKVAAQAAADAATSAAAAAQSALAAQQSAAAAAVDAAAAATADSAAADLAAQASRDAAAANSAASGAESDAAAADALATAAERDAASARQAAADARKAATDAAAAAVQAQKDADEAAKAAATARQDAKAAQDAATQAENDANAQADVNAAGPDGPTGYADVIAIPFITTHDLVRIDCRIIDATHCQATIKYHLVADINYFYRVCRDLTSTDGCSVGYWFYPLGKVHSDTYPTETRILNPLVIGGELLKALATGMMSDLFDCADGKLIHCAIFAGALLLPDGLAFIARAFSALRTALRVGAGIGEALDALRGAGLEADAIAEVEQTAAGSIGKECLDQAACVVDPADVAKMTEDGVKFSQDNLIATGRTADGKVVFLESGTPKAGLAHILSHGPEFVQKYGISEDEIPQFVMTAVTKGKIVGYQGTGTGRPIYEFTYKGADVKVAVTVGDNGFIVGANPTS